MCSIALSLHSRRQSDIIPHSRRKRGVLDGPANGRLSTGNCELIRDERRSAVRVSPSDIELGLIRIKENEIYASSFRLICLLIFFLLLIQFFNRRRRRPQNPNGEKRRSHEE
jgi:hypothetical protein